MHKRHPPLLSMEHESISAPLSLTHRATDRVIHISDENASTIQRTAANQKFLLEEKSTSALESLISPRPGTRYRSEYSCSLKKFVNSSSVLYLSKLSALRISPTLSFNKHFFARMASRSKRRLASRGLIKKTIWNKRL